MSRISVATAILVITLALSSQASSTSGAPVTSTSSAATTSTSSATPSIQGSVAIDKEQFVTAVPSYAVLGENYTLRVVVQSSANITVPIIVRVSTPVDAIFVHPQIVHANVQAMGSAVANFSILPFGAPNSGPFNVTAELYVFFPDSMSSPLLVDQANAVVEGIGPNPFPYLDIAVISAVVITLVLIAAFYPRAYRRMTTVISR